MYVHCYCMSQLYVLEIICEHISYTLSHTHSHAHIHFHNLSAFINLPKLPILLYTAFSSLYYLFGMILPIFCYVIYIYIILYILIYVVYMIILYILYIHKYVCMYHSEIQDGLLQKLQSKNHCNQTYSCHITINYGLEFNVEKRRQQNFPNIKLALLPVPFFSSQKNQIHSFKNIIFILFPNLLPSFTFFLVYVTSTIHMSQPYSFFLLFKLCKEKIQILFIYFLFSSSNLLFISKHQEENQSI